MAFILDELEKIDGQSLNRVYLLYGNDLYLEEEAIQTLSAAFENAYGSAAKIQFYGAERREEEFIQSLVNINMFSTRQIVIYKDLSKLPPTHRKSLVAYLDHPEPTTLLILTTKSGSGTSLFKKLKESNAVTTLSTWSPSPNQFPLLIQQKLQRKGFSITPDALNTLALATNDTLGHALAEMEKIMVYLGDRREITIDDVRLVSGGEKSYQISDLLNAMEQRNLYNSIHICTALIESGNSASYLISSLYNFFVNVWAFKQIHHGKKLRYYPAELQRQQYERAYANYANHDFAALFKALQEADLKTKSTQIKAENLIIPLIYQLQKL